MPRLPRDRQAPSRRGRRSDASNQGRRDGHRHRTGAWQERGRGAPQRASVRRARMHTDCPSLPSGCAEAPSWAHADHGFSAARRTNGGQSSWDEAERTQRTPHGATRRVAIAHPQDFRTESARATPTRRGGHVGCRRRTRGLVCDSSRLRLAAPAAPQTVATRAQARTGTLSGALMSTQAQSSAISSTQQHSGSTRSPHAVAPRRCPRRGRCCLLCLCDCLASFTTALRKPSRFLMACDDAP